MRFIICLFLSFSLSAQIEKTYSDAYLDSIVVPAGRLKKKNLQQIAQHLKINEKNDLLQYSIISKWVINNFYYSYDAKGQNVKYSLSSRKAVCDQYARIVDSLSNYCGLKTEYITGYVKDIEKLNKNKHGLELHAWNSVTIDNKVYLSDITWCDYELGKKNRNTDEMNRFFFLMEPSKFVMTHYPASKKAKYTDYSKKNFLKSPYYTKSYFDFFDDHHGVELKVKKNSIQIKINKELFKKYSVDKFKGVDLEFAEKSKKNKDDDEESYAFEFISDYRGVLTYKIDLKAIDLSLTSKEGVVYLTFQHRESSFISSAIFSFIFK